MPLQLGDIDIYNPDRSIYIKDGRKDRGITRKEDADLQLPSKDADTATILKRFKELGIDTEHAVALLGECNYLASLSAMVRELAQVNLPNMCLQQTGDLIHRLHG